MKAAVARVRSRRRQRGVAAIEFGLLLTFVLVPLTFGVTELGRAAYQYNTMTKSVRDAARYLSEITPGSPALPVQCLAITGVVSNNGSSCSGTPLVQGLSAANVQVCDRVSCPASCNLVPIVVGGVTRGVANLSTVTLNASASSALAFTSLVSAVVPSFKFGAISATFLAKT